jgi:hypothetical protein
MTQCLRHEIQSNSSKVKLFAAMWGQDFYSGDCTAPTYWVTSGQSEERGHSVTNCIEDRGGKFSEPLYLTVTPVEAFQLVGQNDSANGQSRWNRHLKGIALRVTRDRAQHGQSRLLIVKPR